MSALVAALGVLTAASGAYWLVAGAAVRRLLSRAPPLPARLPAASILKPVRGAEPGALEAFETFLLQEGAPPLELVFGVADPDDPAIAVIDALRARHPRARVRLVVAPAPGPNRKASLLAALAGAAAHEVLVVADADMRAGPGWLRRVLSALAEPGVGLVTCPYVGDDARTLPARLEALHMGVTFLPAAALAATVLGVPFAMGSTMALRRETLRALGGFEVLAPYLADDYQLGARVAALGQRVVLCPEILRSALGRTTFRETWDREVRWSRCARAGRPGGHLGYAITFTTPLALALLAATGGAAAGWVALAAALAVRGGVALAAARATRDRASLRWLPLLPVRECLSAAVWAAGLAGRQVTWRGERWRVDRDGRMHPAGRPLTGAAAGPDAPAAPATARPAAR